MLRTSVMGGDVPVKHLAGSKLNSVFLLFCFVFCFVFYGFGGTGGGFGAPGGGFSDNRSGGKPPLLLRLKKPPPGAPKPPPGPPKPTKTKQKTKRKLNKNTV